MPQNYDWAKVSESHQSRATQELAVKNRPGLARDRDQLFGSAKKLLSRISQENRKARWYHELSSLH